ncbi:MFS family permease [Bradyrhizobium japonicum]|nr:MFS family permease [Bradyrhizobium japonicum]MCS3962336.1 MFS family permease [Bradyrhizobium japonicum]MCS3994653.1 MFS family permease [Bradyrhizobium japonicum]
MADMQSGIGPFVGVFLQERGWATGLIGTAMTFGNVAGMLVTTPIGGFIDSSRNKRLWVVIPGICVVLASAIILISQNFWAVTFSQVAQSLASAAIVPAVTGITLGIANQKGFNALNGRNQAFNHAGNMVGAALSGYLGYKFGYVTVFVLAAIFGAIAVACVLMIPAKAIDDRAARGGKEDDPDSPPSGLSILFKHKPLLVLALALALFHLGNAAIVPLYGLAAVAEAQADGPSFVAIAVVIAQGVMIATSLVGMQVAGKRTTGQCCWSLSRCCLFAACSLSSSWDGGVLYQCRCSTASGPDCRLSLSRAWSRARSTAAGALISAREP